MPYLGPKSFDTAPLTTNNLAYLNNKLLESQHPCSSASSSLISSPEEGTLSISTPLSTISSAGSTTDFIRSSSDREDDLNINDDTTVIFGHDNASSSSMSTITELKPNLLKKKSGELVKSSLKLPSLQRSNSMPNAKSVRFANRLEDIKFFDKLEKPTAVSAGTSPLGSPSLVPSWGFQGSSEEDESDSDLENHDSWEITYNDVPYNSNFLNFSKFNANKPIILESLKLNSVKDSLIGFVFVRNLGYEKKILLKLTFDNWKSFVEIDNANYISSNHIFRYSSSEASYDKFSFIIKLRDLCHYKSQLDLSFCIKYEVNKTEYWDNNNMQNYTVSLRKIEKSNYSYKSPRDLTDLDDIKFRLKTNLNFNDSFSSPSYFGFEPRNSKQYLLRKVNSDTSIPTLKGITANSTFVASKTTPKKNQSVSAFTGSQSSRPPHDPLYNKIIENYCFFGSNSHHLQNPDPVAGYADSFCLS